MTDPHDAPRGDPWNAFGYVVAGVATYGLVGFGLDRWWGTSFLVAVGIMIGAVLGLYMTWSRFKAPSETGRPDRAEPRTTHDQSSHPTDPQR